MNNTRRTVMSENKEMNEKIEVAEEGCTGVIQIADDVVSSIAALAVTEVDGVSMLAGNIPNEMVAKLGKRNLAKVIKVTMEEQTINMDISIVVKFGFNVVEVSKAVQERVKQALLNMTGLTVKTVNVKVSGIDLGE